LQIALSLDIPHFSAYSLKVEEGTHFYKLQNEGKLPLPSEDDEYTMYEQVIEKMTEHRYRHYEISNFAKPGYECRHNMTYWRNEHFYGFGAGAHGYIGNVRYENAGPLEAYMRLVDQQGMPHVERLEVSMAEEVENMMIMGLRTREGVERANFHARFGVSVEDVYGEELSALRRKGLVTLRNDRYVLTEKGIYFGNDVFLAFFQSEQAQGIDNREGV
jgi:oxygen-independent coproporphyrinogen III oxidase